MSIVDRTSGHNRFHRKVGGLISEVAMRECLRVEHEIDFVSFQSMPVLAMQRVKGKSVFCRSRGGTMMSFERGECDCRLTSEGERRRKKFQTWWGRPNGIKLEENTTFKYGWGNGSNSTR